jgi:hypothetical protein
MKNLLFLFVFIPTLAFSQVSSWRSNPPQSQRSMPSTMGQRSDISLWRNDGPRDFNRPRPNNSRPNVIVTDPWFYGGWGWNRWDMLGAPGFGWNYWTPMWYQNDWGYRQPARVYVYDDGKIDTVRGKKPVISFGIQKTTDNQVGGFFTIGNKVYFILDYNTTINSDKSDYFGDKTIWNYRNDVMIVNNVPKKISELFPLSSDVIRQSNLYFGIGKRIGRFGTHVSIGTINENIKYRYKDDDGYITFPKYRGRFTTIKIGTLYDYKNFTIKVDYDPIINDGIFGLGINF